MSANLDSVVIEERVEVDVGDEVSNDVPEGDGVGPAEVIVEDLSTTDEENDMNTFLIEEGSRKSEKRDFYCKLVKFILMLLMVFSFMICELLVGILANSLTLISDSFHMFADSMSIFVGMVALVLSTVNATNKFSYGWNRAEVLGGLINAVFLLSVVLFIFLEGFQRFLETETIENPLLVLIVGVVGLVINLVGLCLFGHGHSHSHGHDHGEEERKEHKPDCKKRKNGTNEEENGEGETEEQDDGETTDFSCCQSSDDDEYLDEAIGEVEPFEIDYIMNDPFLSEKKKEKKIEKLKRKRSKDMNKKQKKRQKNAKKKKKKKKKKKRVINLNIMGVFLHVLGDTLGSVAVIIACIFNLVFPPIIKHSVSDDGSETEHTCVKNCFVPYIDPLVSCLLAILILFTTIPLLITTIKILMQGVPGSVSIPKMKARILRIDGVVDVHDVHVWSLVHGRNVCSMHVSSYSESDFMKIAKKIQKILHMHFKIHSCTIQPEFTDVSKKRRKMCKLGRCPPACVQSTCCPGEYIRDLRGIKKRKRKTSEKKDGYQKEKIEEKEEEEEVMSSDDDTDVTDDTDDDDSEEMKEQETKKTEDKEEEEVKEEEEKMDEE